MQYLLFEERGHVGILTINRPKELNALNAALIRELSDFFDTLEDSPLRCLIVTGSGERAFVAGADIGEMCELSPEQAADWSADGNDAFKKLEELPMPTIACINGFALGGGLELALCCDIRIASDAASFSFPEVSLGVTPGYGGIQRLCALTGSGTAAELVFTAARIKAAQALAYGIVNRVVPADELLSTCLELAEAIAKNAPFAVRAAKEVLHGSVGATREEAYLMEAELFGACFATQDQKMAMRSFLKKEKPEPFTGK